MPRADRSDLLDSAELNGGAERALTFTCGELRLCAILHAPARPGRSGLLVVVGGPNYRIGSHRQFVLLGRALSRAGFPVLRFDYRGMGDSEGEQRSFEAVQADIRAAVDAFLGAVDGLREVVLFGLCDAASAALLYAPSDPRVRGLVLVNPWVRSEQSEARTYLRHYYVSRLFSGSFWRKLGRGDFDWRKSLGSLRGLLRRAVARGETHAGEPARSLESRMADGLEQFDGPVLVVLSGADLTAVEFRDTAAASARWRRLLDRPVITVREIPGANHTLSTRTWREQMFDWIRNWLESGSADD